MCVRVTHRGLVGSLYSDSILGPLDVCCRLGPAGHTCQVVQSPSHEQELWGSLNHRVLRGDWRMDTHENIYLWFHLNHGVVNSCIQTNLYKQNSSSQTFVR